MINGTRPKESVPDALPARPGTAEAGTTVRPEGPPHGLWATIRAGIGATLGIVPHVMHHVGLLAGTALLTGALGNGVFYAVGLLLSIPLLRRLRSRFRTWWAPAIGIAVFTTLFSVSAFIVGPAISGRGEQAPAETPTPAVTTIDEHDQHH